VLKKIIKKKIFLFLFFAISIHSQQTEVKIFTKSKNTRQFINKNELFTYKKLSFENIDDLKVNAQKDLELLKKFLKFYGFFDVEIKYEVEINKYKNIVKFHVSEGQRYTLNNITYSAPVQCDISKIINKPFNIKSIENVEKQILESLSLDGFTNAQISKIDLQHNQKAKTVFLCMIINTGEKQLFGNTVINGLKNIPAIKIYKLIKWRSGDTFSPILLDTFRKEVSALNFFSDVKITTAPDGNLQNVFVNLIEDKKYSIECGIKFTTARNINYKNKGIKKLKGLVVHAKWTNNMFGKNCDKFSISAEGMPFYEKNKIVNSINRNISPDYNFKVELLKNELFKDTHHHRIYGEFGQTWFNKYIKKGCLAGYSLSEANHSEYNNSYKIFYENYKLTTFSAEDTKSSSEEIFNYLNLEYTFDIDKRDNFSDPTKGLHAIYTITPEICMNKSAHMLSVNALHSAFFPVVNNRNTAITWIRFKSLIAPPSSSGIPADKMVYSGGAQSIRGYYVDFAGEVKNDIPQGGKSSIELGLEFRHKFSKNWGGCVFIEGARVHENEFPSSGKFYKAYGFGARYYSSFGPIRIDIGFPFKRRSKTDAFAQIYISLGHRF